MATRKTILCLLLLAVGVGLFPSGALAFERIGVRTRLVLQLDVLIPFWRLAVVVFGLGGIPDADVLVLIDCSRNLRCPRALTIRAGTTEASFTVDTAAPGERFRIDATVPGPQLLFATTAGAVPVSVNAPICQPQGQSTGFGTDVTSVTSSNTAVATVKIDNRAAAGGFQYHCVGPGTATITFTYSDAAGTVRTGTLTVNC